MPILLKEILIAILIALFLGFVTSVLQKMLTKQRSLPLPDWMPPYITNKDGKRFYKRRVNYVANDGEEAGPLLGAYFLGITDEDGWNDDDK